MPNSNVTIRCACGASNEDHDDARRTGFKLVRCGRCDVWQHAVCVGLLNHNKNTPSRYVCEECEPASHPRFKFGTRVGFVFTKVGIELNEEGGPDNRQTITAERQEMHLMRRKKNAVAEKKRADWLIVEIMFIVGSYHKALISHWCSCASSLEQPQDECQDLEAAWSFAEDVMSSIRLVLMSLTVRRLDDVRTRLIKEALFGPGEIMVAELWALRNFISGEVMAKIEDQDGTGEKDVRLVRKYFEV